MIGVAMTSSDDPRTPANDHHANLLRRLERLRALSRAFDGLHDAVNDTWFALQEDEKNP